MNVFKSWEKCFAWFWSLERQSSSKPILSGCKLGHIWQTPRASGTSKNQPTCLMGLHLARPVQSPYISELEKSPRNPSLPSPDPVLLAPPSSVFHRSAAGGSGAEKSQSAGLIRSMDKVRKGALIEQPVHPLLLLVGMPSLCLCLRGTDLSVVLCSNLMRRGRRRLLRRRFVYSLTSPCLTEKGPPGVLGTFVQSELHLLFVQVSNLFYSFIFCSCSNLMRKS